MCHLFMCFLILKYLIVITSDILEKKHRYNYGNLRCVGLLYNSQAYLATSSACFARSLACFTRSLADLGMLLQGPRSLTSKRNPPTCCLISCDAKGVVYHQVSYMEAWWYTTPLASHLIRQQVGGFLFNVGLLGPCKSMPRSAKDVASMPRTLQSMPRTAEDIAKHAQELQSKPTHLRFPQCSMQFMMENSLCH